MKAARANSKAQISTLPEENPVVDTRCRNSCYSFRPHFRPGHHCVLTAALQHLPQAIPARILVPIYPNDPLVFGDLRKSLKFSSQPTRCPFFEFQWQICVLSHLRKQGGKRQFLRLFGTSSRFFGNIFQTASVCRCSLLPQLS